MLKKPAALAEISKAIRDQINEILDEKNIPAREIAPEDRLNADLGLDSLDLASLVAALEMRLKADPFQELVPITSVRTVEDLEQAFMKFFSMADEGSQDDDLHEVRRLAEIRRSNSRGTE